MHLPPPLAASHRASARKWLHNLHNAVIFFFLSFLPSSPFISLFCFMYKSILFACNYTFPHSTPDVGRLLIRFRDSGLRRVFPFISSLSYSVVLQCVASAPGVAKCNRPQEYSSLYICCLGCLKGSSVSVFRHERGTQKIP